MIAARIEQSHAQLGVIRFSSASDAADDPKEERRRRMTGTRTREEMAESARRYTEVYLWVSQSRWVIP